MIETLLAHERLALGCRWRSPRDGRNRGGVVGAAKALGGLWVSGMTVAFVAPHPGRL